MRSEVLRKTVSDLLLHASDDHIKAGSRAALPESWALERRRSHVGL